MGLRGPVRLVVRRTKTSPPALPIGPGDLSRCLIASAHGDEASFASFYDATSNRVHGLAARILRDRAQAEEVVQEAYLDAWRHAGRFDPARGTAIGWLLTLVHRRAVDRVRSAEASRRRELADHRLGAPLVEADGEPAPTDVQDLVGALAALTRVQREARERAYFGGHTHSQIGTILQIPLGTAKSRIREGLHRLRDQLTPSEPHRGAAVPATADEANT